MTNNNLMGKADLRSAIQQQLRDDGVFDEITTAVRSRLLGSLLRGNRSTGTSPWLASPMRNESSDQEMALLSLVYNHLEQRGMVHSLSVFAAESKMEHSAKYPLSALDALQELGLKHLFAGHEDLPIELLTLLRAVAQLVSSPPATKEKGAASKAIPEKVSVSAQTEKGLVPVNLQSADGSDGNKENHCHNKHEQNSLGSSNKLIEQRLIEIERDCQQRMKKELDERLRLSAKKQAAYATQRLEHKYKDTLQSLRNQIEEERSRAKTRHDELLQQMSQQKLQMEKESNENEKLVDKLKLEKQTLQSEMDLLNDRVKELQLGRFREWTEEQEAMHRTHEKKINDLEEQKREVSVQQCAMKEKEIKLASLSCSRDRLLAEMQDLRQKQTNSLDLQKTSFEQEYKVIEKNFLEAKADLNAARNETAGLRSLLKQSQAALEAVSFRKVGTAGALANMQSAIYNRSPAMTATQFGQRLPQQQVPVSSDVPLGPSPGSGALRSIVPPSHNGPRSNKEATPKVNLHKHSVITRLVDQQLNVKNGIAKVHKPESPILDVMTSNNAGNNKTQSIKPEDPPCSSAKDPPETESTSNTKEGSLGQKDIHSTEEKGDPVRFIQKGVDTSTGQEKGDAVSSIIPVVGREVVLDDLSAITGITEAVVSCKSVAVPPISSSLDVAEGEHVPVKSSLSREKHQNAGNYSIPENSDGEERDNKDNYQYTNETPTEDHANQSVASNNMVHSELDSLKSVEGSFSVETGIVADLASEKLQVKDEHNLDSKDIHHNPGSIASEATNSEQEYSEFLESVVQEEPNHHPNNTPPEDRGEPSSSPSPGSPHSDDYSSDGYSESFCSFEK